MAIYKYICNVINYCKYPILISFKILLNSGRGRFFVLLYNTIYGPYGLTH